MNKTLNAIFNKYGAEVVVARILEQFKLLATSKDEDVVNVVKDLVLSFKSDTEYIYCLCEYTNIITYVSENIEITDGEWEDEPTRTCLISGEANDYEC